MPECPDSDADAARLQLFLEFGERDVRRLCDLTKEEGRFGLDAARLAVAALPLGRDVALLDQPLTPTDQTHSPQIVQPLGGTKDPVQ